MKSQHNRNYIITNLKTKFYLFLAGILLNLSPGGPSVITYSTCWPGCN